MPYIGHNIRAADDYRLIDDISSSFNGSTTTFALTVNGASPTPFPKSPQQCLISVNGVIQEPDPSGSSGFNLSGTNIVFSSAPTNGHAFFGIIYATADYINAGGTFPAGNSSTPSISFTSDTDTGFYRKASGSIGFVSNSTEIANVDSNGITSTQFIGGGAGITGIAAGNIASGTIATARIPTLNQNTTGTAAIATTITVADESSDTTCFPLFSTAATGDLAPKSGSNLTFNSSSGLLTATSFSGSGASLTSLNASNISSGTLSASRIPTLNQDTSGTAAIATTITVADESSDTGCNVLFATSASGNLAPKSGSNLTFNSSSGALSATTFVGNIDAVDGDFDGTLEADAITIGGTALNTVIAGVTVTNATNAGNADTVDSLHASSFVRSDTADTASGIITFSGGIVLGNNARCKADINNLSDGSTITVDYASGVVHTVTLQGNRTLNQTNAINCIGQSGSIFIVQDGSGSRTLAFNSAYKFPGGTAPTLSTSPNAIDRLDYIIRGDADIHAVVSLDVKS